MIITRLIEGGVMLSKTHKFTTVFLVILLVLGLALVACTSQKPAETEQPAAPPTQEQTPLSYEATTYTNSQYGLSIQYPKDWEEYPAVVTGTVIASFSVPGFIPGVSISVRDAAAPLTADRS